MSTDIPGSSVDSPDPARTVRVLIVDDHAVVRQGLRTFLELQDDVLPGDPSTLPIEVVGEAADGVQAVTYIAEGENSYHGDRYLFALTWGDSAYVTFAWSNTNDLRTTTALEEEPVAWWEGYLGGDVDKWRQWQTLNFVWGTGGSLWLIGADKDGDDWLGLFSVDPSRIAPADITAAVGYVREKDLYLSYPDMGSLDAASGVYVSPAGNLIVYTGPHDNDAPGGSIEMGEFRSINLNHSGTLPDVCSGWIELYDSAHGWTDSSDEGRCLMFDFQDQSLDDWNDLDEYDDGFGNKTSSLRWNLAPGQFAWLHKDADYGDAGVKLCGNGDVGHVWDLDDGFFHCGTGYGQRLS
jgi:CheY-like chemotaxis protein